MTEVWRNIGGFSRYEVSNLGRVRRGQKIMTACPDTAGYLRVSMTDDLGQARQRSVHILVAKAFLPNPKELPTVNHKDLDKNNCQADNLEWRSRAGQMHHARATKFVQAGIDYFTDGRAKPYRARYALNGKHIHVGVFATREAALKARNAAVAALPYTE